MRHLNAGPLAPPINRLSKTSRLLRCKCTAPIWGFSLETDYLMKFFFWNLIWRYFHWLNSYKGDWNPSGECPKTTVVQRVAFRIVNRSVRAMDNRGVNPLPAEISPRIRLYRFICWFGREESWIKLFEAQLECPPPRMSFIMWSNWGWACKENDWL